MIVHICTHTHTHTQTHTHKQDVKKKYEKKLKKVREACVERRKDDVAGIEARKTKHIQTLMATHKVRIDLFSYCNLTLRAMC
jgi:hypothetical protein